MNEKKTINNHRVKRKMNITQWITKAVSLSLLFVLTSTAWAAGAISSITSGEQSGEIVVKVRLSEPFTQSPSGFVMQNPARVAVDLPGVSNGTGRNLFDLNQGNLRSVTVVEAEDRTRLVLNLGTSTTFEAAVEGDLLIIKLAQPKISSTTSEAKSVYDTPQVAQTSSSSYGVTKGEIKSIDFRPSTEGAGSLMIQLPSDKTQVQVKAQGSKVVVDIQDAVLPDSLRKILDASDFQTPMKVITPEQVGSNVRLTITSNGDWDQSSYQAQDQFVLEMHPAKQSSSKATPGMGYKGKELTLSFQDIEVRSLLRVIADFTELNVVTSDSVNGSLTLHLKNVPWDQALEIILQSKGLALHRSGNVLWIAPRGEILDIQLSKQRQDQENEALAPLRTQVFQLNYAEAEAIMTAIKGTGTSKAASILSERGSVIVDPRTNKLIVTDIPEKLENIVSVLQEVDVPVRQVMIEARIVEATDGWGRSLGMRLSGNFKGHNKWLTGGTMPSEDEGGSSSGTENEWSQKQDKYNFFNLPADAVNGHRPSYFAFQFAQSANQYLQLEIQALEQERYGRSIASPQLTTADMKTAIVEQGVEIPYQEASSSGATSTSFKSAVLSLEVTPRITPNGEVGMQIKVTQDTRGPETDAGPSISTNRVETEVTVENGGTLVIGGIYKEEELTVKTKIPLLGDIPLLGQFFRSNNRRSERIELLVFITPKIVADGLYRGGSMNRNLASN